MKNLPIANQDLFSSIASIIVQARTKIYKHNNTLLLQTYWNTRTLERNIKKQFEFMVDGRRLTPGLLW
jgi:hypothetical protein